MEEPLIPNIIPTIEVTKSIEEISTAKHKEDLRHQVISPIAIPKYLRQIDKSIQTLMCAYYWVPFQTKPSLRKGQSSHLLNLQSPSPPPNEQEQQINLVASMLAEKKFPIIVNDKKGKNIHPLEVIDEDIDRPTEVQLEQKGTSVIGEPTVLVEEIVEKQKEPKDLGPITPDISKLFSTSLGIGLCSSIPYGIQNAPTLCHEKSHDPKYNMEVLKIIQRFARTNSIQKSPAIRQVSASISLLSYLAQWYYNS